MTASSTPPTPAPSRQATRQRLIAMRVRQHRVKLGLTQAQAADRAGLPLRTYRRFEAAGRGNVETLYAIAAAFRRAQVIDSVFGVWGDVVVRGVDAAGLQLQAKERG